MVSSTHEQKVLDSGLHAVDSGFQVLDSSFCRWNLNSGFQSLVEFRTPYAVFQIPKPRILDSTKQKFLDSEILIPLHEAISIFFHYYLF